MRLMRIERRYTKDGQSAYQDMTFRHVASEIRNPDGSVGTRNLLGITTTVQCVAGVLDVAVQRIRSELLPRYPNVDGVVALTHGMGCATASDGEELQVLRRTLGGYAKHANFYAVLVVGLGCETNQIQGLVAQEGLQEGVKLVTFNIQETGGTTKTVQKGIQLIQALLPEANQVQRVPVPVKHLTVGLQCGGSDGYSGISANPALGAAVEHDRRAGRWCSRRSAYRKRCCTRCSCRQGCRRLP